MKTVIEMAREVLDRMAPDDHCREPYWTATNEELERFAALVIANHPPQQPGRKPAQPKRLDVPRDGVAFV